jgi:hypothetical protein
MSPLVTEGKEVIVKAGDSSYSFDSSSAELTSASYKGVPAILGAQLTLWRPLNSTEQIIVDSEGGPKSLPDLNQYHTIVHSWKVTRLADQVQIDARADNIVDARDHFEVTYSYLIRNDGELSIHYVVHPELQARWLPLIGMSLRTSIEMNHLRWLGLGPLDSYPNEKAAAILGVWAEDRAKADVNEVKATRWAELTGSSGAGIRLEGAPYLRVSDASGVQALSAVAGRPSKRNRAEFPEQRLDVTPQATFAGEFKLSLVGAGSASR